MLHDFKRIYKTETSSEVHKQYYNTCLCTLLLFLVIYYLFLYYFS